MNNAKVRIYDLSKELHLENKEIIEICEYLNIPVKSHSSTITEDEAERIKATAEKYGGAISQAVAKAEKKGHNPEIVGIYHKPNRSASTSDGGSKVGSPVLVSPPSRNSQPKPSIVPPPIPKPQRPIPPSVSAKATEEKAPIAPQSPKNPDKKPEKLEMPELLSPPSRSVQKAPEKAPEKTIEKAPEKPIEKPILQAPKPNLENKGKPKESKESKETKENKESLGEKRRDKKDKPKNKEKSPDKSVQNLKKKPKKLKPAAEETELKRPQSPKAEVPTLAPPPSKPTAVPEPEDIEEKEDTIDTELPLGHKKPKQKLKRPTLPGSAKTAQWDEDEDERKIKEKSAKVGKNKRRKPILEDDEDFETELQENVAAKSFSLSTARPPKPKSEEQGTSTPTNKPKKAPVKANQAPPRSRAERRERKEQVRPETVVLSRDLTVRELSELIQVPETEIIKNLFFKGIPVNITQTLDLEIATQVAEEFEVLVTSPEEKAAAAKSTEMLDDADLDNLQRRPPVVTIMGHVDHGKTTLLDSIRKTKVAQGEAGGITQHIGAYHVDVEHNGEPQQIVFLDTPGHEAFTAMRARGAKVTDIAILVVAADDGVQPQTREAISHAQAAEVPLIVAINKVDKAEANPDRIKQELAELGLVPEEWGGETTMVPVSALKGDNLDELLEMILLVSDLEEMSANPDRSARGTVIEANLDRSRGPVATLLVQNGTLKVGDIVVAGAVMGKIRAMIDDRGQKVEAATPSFAVEILGLGEVPAAGDEFEVFSNEKEAKAIADERAMANRETRLQKAMSGRRISLSTLSAQAQEGELKELNLILKADVQGSVEAIVGALEQLPQGEVQIRILLAAPGEISETDVDLAAASGAVVVGFSTTLASGARAAADREGVDIREYDIIYKLLDDIEGAMEGLLDPEEVESPLGTAEVRAVFAVGRGAVAGCYVQSGKIVRNRLMRVRRQKDVVFEGTIDSLKRMKEDAREVNSGYECGIGSSKFTDWQEGDSIEAYEMVMKRRTLAGK